VAGADPIEQQPLDDSDLVGEEEEEAPRSVVPERLAHQLRTRSATLRCTLAAVGAWVITVLPLGFAARAGLFTRLVVFLAILPGVAGPQLFARNHRNARHVGLTAFVSACLLAWALASRDGVLSSIDVFRGVLGGLAWGVFAVAWSHPWSVPDPQLKTAPAGRTTGLKPRRQPPRYAVGISVVGAGCALVCLVLAWRVADPTRAVFAQAVAAGCAIALLTSASAVAVLVGRDKRSSKSKKPRPLFSRAVLNTVLLMVLVIGLAVLVQLTKH